MRYALVKDSLVINVIVWDGESEVDFGDGVTAVQSDTLNIGDSYE